MLTEKEVKRRIDWFSAKYNAKLYAIYLIDNTVEVVVANAKNGKPVYRINEDLTVEPGKIKFGW